MEKLKPPFGLEFGQEIYTVINDVKKIAGAHYYESQSDLNRVTFLYLKISGRKCETIFIYRKIVSSRPPIPDINK